MFKFRLITTLLVLLLWTTAFAEEHLNEFELSESFIRDVWHFPVTELGVIIGCAGSVHKAKDDCEIHIGAKLEDTSISDYPDVVLEPPNVCKNKSRTLTGWRTFYNSVARDHCWRL